MTDRDLLHQALDALLSHPASTRVTETIAALSARLAEPERTVTLPPLPEHVATIGTDGHPRHQSHLWGAREERLYGPPSPLFTADQMHDYAIAALRAAGVGVREHE